MQNHLTSSTTTTMIDWKSPHSMLLQQEAIDKVRLTELNFGMMTYTLS